jgi:type IV fimbrial biogenesis protein FimT
MKLGLKHSGVSLIELMVVITVAAVLMAIAVPSYKYVTTSNRIAGEINGLMGDLQFARYEAIKEGLSVTICPVASATAVTCTATTSWGSGGWIVLPNANAQNAGAVLRRQLPFSSFGSLDSVSSGTGVTSLLYNREGFVTLAAGASTGGTLVFSLHDPSNNSGFTRCLVVSAAGSLTTISSGKTAYTTGTC